MPGGVRSHRDLPSPSDRDTAEGSRDVIDRELARTTGEHAGKKPDGIAAARPAKERSAPGDEADPGTPGTGEDVCPRCKGTGEVDDDECPACEGTGVIIEGIGGG